MPTPRFDSNPPVESPMPTPRFDINPPVVVPRPSFVKLSIRLKLVVLSLDGRALIPLPVHTLTLFDHVSVHSDGIHEDDNADYNYADDSTPFISKTHWTMLKRLNTLDAAQDVPIWRVTFAYPCAHHCRQLVLYASKVNSNITHPSSG